MTITEVPTLDNLKSFMVFDGTPSVDTYMFDGNCHHFADCFFSNPTWEAITDWAKDQGYTLVIAGTPLYEEMDALYKEANADEDFYDADGNIDDMGIFDAGGHVADVERYLDYADSIRDRIRDEG